MNSSWPFFRCVQQFRFSLTWSTSSRTNCFVSLSCSFHHRQKNAVSTWGEARKTKEKDFHLDKPLFWIEGKLSDDSVNSILNLINIRSIRRLLESLYPGSLCFPWPSTTMAAQVVFVHLFCSLLLQKVHALTVLSQPTSSWLWGSTWTFILFATPALHDDRSHALKTKGAKKGRRSSKVE